MRDAGWGRVGKSWVMKGCGRTPGGNSEQDLHLRINLTQGNWSLSVAAICGLEIASWGRLFLLLLVGNSLQKAAPVSVWQPHWQQLGDKCITFPKVGQGGKWRPFTTDNNVSFPSPTIKLKVPSPHWNRKQTTWGGVNLVLQSLPSFTCTSHICILPALKLFEFGILDLNKCQGSHS